MGLFKRPAGAGRGGRRPDGFSVADLERFARHMRHYAENLWPSVWEDLVAPTHERYRADEDAFLSALADFAELRGGLAAHGAERLMIEVAGGDLEHPAYARVMEASLAFLRASGVPPRDVTGYEWGYWIASGGTNETWIRRRPAPAAEAARVSELGIGQTRRLAQLFADDASNVFLVRRAEDGRYCWVIDARRSDEDARRTQRVHQTAESLHELYAQIGLALQVPPHWHDPELEPYFPLPKPTF